MPQGKFNAFSGFSVEVSENGLAELILGEIGRMPVVDAKGHSDLANIWGELSRDNSIRAILIRSQGKGFSAGGEMSLVSEMLTSYPTRIRVMREVREIVLGMIECDVPIVSAINGAAVGAGAALALLADVSVAGRNAKIIDGHTKIGVAAGDHAAVIWPLLCGMAKAKYYLLTCEPLVGSEAERIGLVSLSVPDEEVLSKAKSIALQLAQGSREALGFTKRSLNHWLRSAWPAFEHSAALEMLSFGSPDAQEGISALQAKRSPDFRS
jgi:enoyl-CoA hydratase